MQKVKLATKQIIYNGTEEIALLTLDGKLVFFEGVPEDIREAVRTKLKEKGFEFFEKK